MPLRLKPGIRNSLTNLRLREAVRPSRSTTASATGTMTWDRVTNARRHLLLQRLGLLGIGLTAWITAVSMLVVHGILHPPAIAWPTTTPTQPDGLVAMISAMVAWMSLTTAHLVWFMFPFIGAVILATAGLCLLAPVANACTRLGRHHPTPASLRHRSLRQFLSGAIMLGSLATPWLLAPTITTLLNQNAQQGPVFATSIICLFMTVLILGAVAIGLTSGPAIADWIAARRTVPTPS